MASGSGGEKKDFQVVEYGNTHGEIRFGHLWGVEGSNVQSDVCLQASDPIHYFTLEKGSKSNGERTGWTCSRNPGVFEVKCGDTVDEDKPAIYIEAINGDIVLKASNGKIRLQALDVDIQAIGEDNKRGVVDIKANETINLDAKIVNLGSNKTTAMKILSTGIGEMTFKSSLTMYAGLGKAITSTVGEGGKDSKFGGKDFLDGPVNGGTSSILGGIL